MNIHIRRFHTGPVSDETALEQFQKQWATYQKLVDADALSHKAVGKILHDTLAGGEPIRVLTAIDLCTRECVALIASKTFTGSDVARLLSEAGSKRGGLPRRIRVDNGTEFTSKALDHWAYWNHVQLDFSRPGKPSDNAFIESFNATLRRECLSQHWFLTAADAQQTLDAWREDYNNTRPHGSLADRPPAEYRRTGPWLPGPQRLETSHF